MIASNDIHSLVSKLVALKQDVCCYKVDFSKPLCSCFTTLARHQHFWIKCFEAIDAVDELISIALHVICDPGKCVCTTSMTMLWHSVSLLVQTVIYYLAQYKGHQRQGSTFTMVENRALLIFFNSCIDRACHLKKDVYYGLAKCIRGHEFIINQYYICDMDQ